MRYATHLEGSRPCTVCSQRRAVQLRSIASGRDFAGLRRQPDRGVGGAKPVIVAPFDDLEEEPLVKGVGVRSERTRRRPREVWAKRLIVLQGVSGTDAQTFVQQRDLLVIEAIQLCGLTSLFQGNPRLWTLPISGGDAGLRSVAGGLSVHFLQKLAHCIELRAEALPISGFQSLHCLIVAIECLPCLTCRRACAGPLFWRA